MFINKPGQKSKLPINILLLSMIGISGTIGGSIFVLLSGGIELAGIYLPVAFLIGGLLALAGGLLYAEVGTTIPKPGSDLVYVFTASKRRYLPFLFSWMILLGNVGYLAINALGFGFYIGIATGLNPALTAILGIIGAVALNIKGAQKAGRFEVVSVLLLVSLFAAFAMYVFSAEPTFASFATESFQLGGVLAATALIFTSFVGYEYVTTLAGEVDKPNRTIPIALVITLVVSTIIFALVAYVTSIGAPRADLVASDAPLLIVADTIGGAGMAIVIPAAIFATGGSMVAAVMITSRRLYAIVNQGFFGSFLAKRNRHKVPMRAAIVSAGFASLLVLSQAVNFVAYMANSVYLIGLIIIALSIMSLRKKRPYLARPFRVPFYPVIPLLVIAIAGTLLSFVGLQSLLLVGLWVIIGWFAYLLSTIDKDRWQLIGRGALLFAFLLLTVIFAASFLAIEYLLTQ